MPKQPEPGSETPPDEAVTPVPNRRERRGGKSTTFSPGAGKSAAGRNPGVVPNPRQYSTRRRGG